MGTTKKDPLTITLRKVFTLGTSAAFAVALAPSAWGTKVLVIDQGVDLDHSGLREFQSRNLQELQGRTGVDDDRNGFVDDIMGWNAVSNDAQFFPPKVKNYFVQNRADVMNSFAAVQSIQDGDMSAVEACKVTDTAGKVRWKKEDAGCMTLRKHVFAGQALMEYSHGTHVAGIVAKGSRTSAQIASLNLFNGSTEEASVDEPATRPDSPADPNDAKRPNIFDMPKAPDILIAQKSFEDARSADTISRYVKASGAKVVNISLATTELSLRTMIEGAWKSEVKRLKLDPKTERNAAQQAVYDRLVSGLYDSAKSMWSKVLNDNPDVLFVIAAGNDGATEGVARAGDNGVYGVYPANASVEFTNVITVAATDDRGALVDFSNYNAELVNVGAPGKSILSYAPANLEVRMSGTSMAAPYVTGLASHLRSLNPQLTAAQTRTILEKTSRPTASLQGKTTSGGVVNAEAAIVAAQGYNFGLTLFTPGGLLDFVKERIPGFELPSDDTSFGELASTTDFEKALARRLVHGKNSVKGLIDQLR